ncbi:MAG: type II toxin-antitoxin system Phd/YefM family antitoxin [Flammeovirgaceae bacterium]|nr:type II toxin-antitoxin system Phd/YefM family antitoxin [Flammeovirgaceae bacterium]
MKTVSIGEFKANLSEYAEKIQKGAEYIITYGRKKKKIFRVGPIKEEKPFKRKLGLMQGKAKVIFHDDWKMTTEEFLGS